MHQNEKNNLKVKISFYLTRQLKILFFIFLKNQSFLQHLSMITWSQCWTNVVIIENYKNKIIYRLIFLEFLHLLHQLKMSNVIFTGFIYQKIFIPNILIGYTFLK